MNKTDDMKVFFENIKDKKAIVVNSLLRSKYIYHYTSQKGLEGIINNNSLWFTDMRYLNDKEELIDGIKVACNLKSDKELAGLDKASFSEHMYNIFCKEILKRNFFVCCFSISSDELPMWNYYTKDNNNKGYNLVLDYKRLLASIVYENKDVLNDCKVTFGKVEYSDNIKKKFNETLFGKFVQEQPQYIKTIFEITMKELNFTIKEEYIDQYMQEITEIYSTADKCKLPSILSYDGVKLQFEKNLFSENVVYCKNRKFSFEKEVRIVIEIPEDKISYLKQKGVYKVLNKERLEMPYLDLKFDNHCIQGITLSPTLDMDIAFSELEQFLSKNKIDILSLKKGIRKSDIPMRY